MAAGEASGALSAPSASGPSASVDVAPRTDDGPAAGASSRPGDAAAAGATPATGAETAGTPPPGAPTVGAAEEPAPDQPVATGPQESVEPPVAQPSLIEPPTKPLRAGGDCPGRAVRGGTYDYGVAVVTVFFDSVSGRNCALLTKRAHFGERSYLKLSLCNDAGRCDDDWNYYPREAGPVAVAGRGSCVNLTVAVLDAGRTAWLLPETSVRGHCS
jgi:hypothetical protein